ncbi:hypothetical protein [Enterococcus faecium]|nr:hypothetical protein [Enterococcus faecium]
MIQRQIKRILGRDIQITHVSEEQYEKVDLNKYFAVFTTIPLKNVNEETPVIHLTNLFDDSWLRAQWQKAKKKAISRVSFYCFFLSNMERKKDVSRIFKQISRSFDQRLLCG